MPTNYTLTFNGEKRHHVCKANSGAVTLFLVVDGKVEFRESSQQFYVDLLTIYFTQTGGQYPSPPESFTVNIDNGMGLTVEPIYQDQTNNGSTIVASEGTGHWTLTVTSPNNDYVTNYQLNTDGATPANKLKIRVKRQPAFSCTSGPFDDEFGDPLP